MWLIYNLILNGLGGLVGWAGFWQGRAWKRDLGYGIIKGPVPYFFKTRCTQKHNRLSKDHNPEILHAATDEL